MTTTPKAIVANYSEEVLAIIIADYKAGKQSGKQNADILAEIAKKVKKTVPSLRAKLSSLKVYQADNTAGKPAEGKAGGTNKEQLADKLRTLTGSPLANIDAGSKTALQELILAIVNRDKQISDLNQKVDDLVTELLEGTGDSNYIEGTN